MDFFLGYPITVTEAVDILMNIITDDDKYIIKSKSEEELIGMHFGLGKFIRNEFGLLKENYELIADCKAIDADITSIVIIKGFWKKLREENKI